MADGLLDLPLTRELLGTAAAAGVDIEAALDDEAALRQTEVAQPALLLVEAVLAGELRGVDVIGVAGHSVGEYAALVAAGALTPQTAMELVLARGRAMAAMHEGTMAALLGADVEVAQAVCAEVRERGDTVVVANFNAPGQVVLSGTRSGVDAAVELARQRGVRKVMPLRVSGAFHSPLMTEAAELFGSVLDAAPITAARVPVACNVDGALVSGSEELRDRLRRQLVSPVRWSDCVAALVELGIDALVEVGPQNVLTGLARRIAPDTRAVAVSTLADAHDATQRLGLAVHG